MYLKGAEETNRTVIWVYIHHLLGGTEETVEIPGSRRLPGKLFATGFPKYEAHLIPLYRNW